jgi:hypothetical protein
VEQKRSELDTMRLIPDGGAYEVVLSKEDTDWQFSYTFEPHDGCWRLVGVDDQSL